MALEAAVGAGRLEKVDDSGGCDTSPALQAGLVGVPFLVLGAWTLLRSVRVLRDGRNGGLLKQCGFEASQVFKF